MSNSPSPTPDSPNQQPQHSRPDLLAILQEDYRNFPRDQHYEIYALDVQFRDPFNRFQGADRYRKMIGFLEFWLPDAHIDLHEIQAIDSQIRTEWTLSWRLPFAGQWRMAIRGWSDLQVNDQGLICQHIDYWRAVQWPSRGRSGF